MYISSKRKVGAKVKKRTYKAIGVDIEVLFLIKALLTNSSLLVGKRLY